MQVAGLLVLSATVAGTVVGFTAGVTWAVGGFPRLPPRAAIITVAAALLADVVCGRWGHFQPWSVQRQVPRVWARLFDLRTAATLFGARLGVGPLTHLRSWLWWAATVLAASSGPGPSVLVGATFGAVRMVTVVAVSLHVQPAMPSRMATLLRREPTLARVLAAASLGACLMLPGLA